jgi:succinate dehydrogenase/fumarate reductase flavoprotein subunit
MIAQVKFTLGGLKVDPAGRVLNTSDAPIPGLYAAGEITGLFHHKQPPQTSVLRSSTFGRIVGTNVAESLPESAAVAGA